MFSEAFCSPLAEHITDVAVVAAPVEPLAWGNSARLKNLTIGTPAWAAKTAMLPVGPASLPFGGG